MQIKERSVNLNLKISQYIMKNILERTNIGKTKPRNENNDVSLGSTSPAKPLSIVINTKMILKYKRNLYDFFFLCIIIFTSDE